MKNNPYRREIGECTRAMLNKQAGEQVISLICEHCDHSYFTCAKAMSSFEGTICSSCPSCRKRVFAINISNMSMAQCAIARGEEL